MATNVQKSQPTNWLTWGGAAVAVLVVLGAVAYWMDWFGAAPTDAVTPAVEETAPADE